MAGIPGTVFWIIMGGFALCGIVIAIIALSMRNPKE